MSTRRAARSLAAIDMDGWKIPPELAIGRCVEVWSIDVPSQGGSHPSIPVEACRRYAVALKDFATENQIARRDLIRILGPRSPYSASYAIAAGRESEIRSRFAAAGVTVDDIPRLREATFAGTRTGWRP